MYTTHRTQTHLDSDVENGLNARYFRFADAALLEAPRTALAKCFMPAWHCWQTRWHGGGVGGGGGGGGRAGGRAGGTISTREEEQFQDRHGERGRREGGKGEMDGERAG